MRPLAITRLPVVPDKHFLRVFIWPSEEDLCAATRRECAAYWNAPTTHVWVDDNGNTDVLDRLVSDLHFSVGRIGGGIVAHELQHFIQHWIDIGQVDLENEEAAPKVAGDLTYLFWTWWHNSFTVPEK